VGCFLLVFCSERLVDFRSQVRAASVGAFGQADARAAIHLWTGASIVEGPVGLASRSSFDRLGGCAQDQLVKVEVQPAAELEADLPNAAGVLEAERLV
jgi:hypothetical protein